MNNKKYTYLFGLVEAINCNPNGNPDDDNFPRIVSYNWDYKLELSPYSIKRKMRNAWSDLGLKVILDEKYRSKTIKTAYAEAFKEYGSKLSKKWDEVDLSWLTEDIIEEYVDIVFWIYRDMKVKNIPDELFLKIKKQQLVVSEAQSLNLVWHKLDEFRKGLTSHFTSDNTKNEQAWWMWTYNSIDYALFPIVMSSQVEYKNLENILKGFVNGFNHNMTATKNFNVVTWLMVTLDIPLKKSFVYTPNPEVDWPNLELSILDSAKNIKVSGLEYIEGKWYNEIRNEDLYEILKKHINTYLYYNKK